MFSILRSLGAFSFVGFSSDFVSFAVFFDFFSFTSWSLPMSSWLGGKAERNWTICDEVFDEVTFGKQGVCSLLRGAWVRRKEKSIRGEVSRFKYVYFSSKETATMNDGLNTVTTRVTNMTSIHKKGRQSGTLVL